MLLQPDLPNESRSVLEGVPFPNQSLRQDYLSFLLRPVLLRHPGYRRGSVSTLARAIYLLRSPLLDVVIAAASAGTSQFLARRVQHEETELYPRIPVDSLLPEQSFKLRV